MGSRLAKDKSFSKKKPRVNTHDELFTSKSHDITRLNCIYSIPSSNSFAELSNVVPKSILYENHGYPHPRSGREGGGYPHPRSGWGYPHPRTGEYPHSGQPADGGYLPSISRMGYSPTPHQQDGGIPHPGYRSGWGGTPNLNSITCTCYAAGGMPLAFRQEDFLVWF